MDSALFSRQTLDQMSDGQVLEAILVLESDLKDEGIPVSKRAGKMTGSRRGVSLAKSFVVQQEMQILWCSLHFQESHHCSRKGACNRGNAKTHWERDLKAFGPLCVCVCVQASVTQSIV